MKMYCDKQTAIFIANNTVFHERTKHVKVDCCLIRDLLLKKQITTAYVRSDNQLDDILTKPLACGPFCYLFPSWACLICMLLLEGAC